MELPPFAVRALVPIVATLRTMADDDPHSHDDPQERDDCLEDEGDYEPTGNVTEKDEDLSGSFCEEVQLRKVDAEQVEYLRPDNSANRPIPSAQDGDADVNENK